MCASPMDEMKFTRTHTMIVGTTEERLLRRRSNRSDMDVDWLSVEMVFGTYVVVISDEALCGGNK